MVEYAFEFKWIRGEREDFWVSPSDFSFAVAVAVLRGWFGLLTGRNKSWGDLQSCREHSYLVARRIS